MLISIIIVIKSKLTLLGWDVQLRWYLHKQHTSQAVRNSQFSSASLHCESDDQNLSRLATFIRSSLHSAFCIQQLRRHGRASSESYFKSHAIEIRFWWHVYIVVFLKQKTHWNVHPICFGQLTMVLVLQIMAFVRWTVIAHYVVVSSITLSSLELRKSVKALRQNVRTDGKNVRALAQTVRALAQTVRALVKNVKPIFKTVEYPSTGR